MKALVPALLMAVALVGVNGAAAGESIEYVYRLHCSGCHGTEGAGSKIGRIPPFAGIVGHFAASSAGRLYLVRVPGVANAALPDSDTAELLNYVLRNWGDSDLPAHAHDFTAAEVHKLRDTPVDDIVALRRTLAAELSRQGISVNY